MGGEVDAPVKQILLGNLSSKIRGNARLLLTGDETLLKVKEMIADLIRETGKEDPEEIKIIVSGKLVTPDTAAINTIHMDDDPQDNYKWENWLSSGHILWKPNNHVGPQPIAPEDAKRQVSSTPPTRGYISNRQPIAPNNVPKVASKATQTTDTEVPTTE